MPGPMSAPNGTYSLTTTQGAARRHDLQQQNKLMTGKTAVKKGKTPEPVKEKKVHSILKQRKERKRQEKENKS